MDLTIRPRRIRKGEILRKMVRETRMDPSSLIYPMFVREGEGIAEEIPTMPGQYRYSVDRMGEKLDRLKEAGVSSVILFGIPGYKDETGSGAWAEDGIVQKALRRMKKDFPQMYAITDVCMCEYTSLVTAAFSAAMRWTMTKRLSFCQRRPFLTYRQEPIWWLLLI